MNVKVEELMTQSVIVIEWNKTIDQAHAMLTEHNIGALPVVNDEGEAVGFVSQSDILHDVVGSDPVAAIMGEKVYTIEQSEDVSVAAKIMREHAIHRLIVTKDKKMVGIISAVDLLVLIENPR